MLGKFDTVQNSDDLMKLMKLGVSNYGVSFFMGTISHPPIFGETESKNLMYFQSKGTQNVNVLNKYLPRKHRYHGESKSQHELLRTIYMSIS